MSDEFAIATVTAALKTTIHAAITHTVGGATVHMGRPDSLVVEENKPKTGLYLYQIRRNPALRNHWNPLRSGDGTLRTSPRVAVDLYYLISFYGDSAQLHPELMAAEVVRVLEATPVLTRSLITATIGAANADHKSDLDKAVETVKATPIEMDLEELSKLWSIFFQVPYALSLPYMFSYVIVEAEQQGGPALPVTRPVISPLPLSKVSIDAVEAETGPSDPIVWGGKLRIRGRDLVKPGLRIQVDGNDVVLDAKEVRATEIVLPLSTTSFAGDELAAGAHTVHAVDPSPDGAQAHLERTSELMPFKLRPRLTDVDPIESDPGKVGKIKVKFKPAIVVDQAVRLLLDELVNVAPKSYQLTPSEVPANEFPKAELEFPSIDVKAGTYLVSAQVDSVYSAPQVGDDPGQPDFGQIKGPNVVIP